MKGKIDKEKHKKEKNINQDFIYGIHPIRMLLQREPERVLELIHAESREDKKLQEIISLAKTHSIAIHSKIKKDLDHQFPNTHHQGVVARIRPKDLYDENDLEALIEHQTLPPLFLILDGVQDPHNLGACLRTADAAGVTAVIIPKDRSCGVTPSVRKVSAGASESVPIVQVGNLARTLEKLKKLGVWLIGASAETKQSLFETDLKGPIAVVLGAEGTGLRHLTQEHCDILMHIPMVGMVESLNVSVAAGISLFEAFRQRR